MYLSPVFPRAARGLCALWQSWKLFPKLCTSPFRARAAHLQTQLLPNQAVTGGALRDARSQSLKCPTAPG